MSEDNNPVHKQQAYKLQLVLINVINFWTLKFHKV